MAALPIMLPAALDVLAQMPHALWRGNQMASYKASVVTSGFPLLDDELPNHGWPCSSLIELLLQQAGIGEMQLLKTALVTLTQKRRIALIQPPHLPHGAACHAWGLQAENLLWIKTKTSADALWTAEQIIKNGSCGAVLLWQTNVRSEALRRLNLAAQSADTYFWLLRPISAQQDTSPAPLRLALRPAVGGVKVEIVKRRGPHSDKTVRLTLDGMPTSRHLPEQHHALVDQRTPAIIAVRSAQTLLV